MEFSPLRFFGWVFCFILGLGMVAPLFIVDFNFASLHPLTVGSDFRAGIAFVVILFIALAGLCFRKYLVTALAGVLSLAAEYGLYAFMQDTINSLSTRATDTVGSVNGILGMIAGFAAETVVNSSVQISWGWYVIGAAGIGLILVGLIGFFVGIAKKGKDANPE